MNSTINSILNHRSIRSYTDKEISVEELDAILACAQAAPSSINGQQMSVVVVKDQATKDKIAEFAGGQPWISQAPVFLLFVADFYRAKLAGDKIGQPLVIAGNMEGTLVGSIDTGLAMGNTIAAAESLGLGTVCIGGIRNNPQGMIDLLGLPEYVYPLVGLCVGHPNTETLPDKKPRFEKDAVIHIEKYNTDLKKHIDTYDETIKKYMAARGQGQNIHDWSGAIGNTYNKVYFPKVSQTLRSQQFKCE
ncbi:MULTISPECIES: NADPH-dependent oxidoreductase [unclassified Fusibacter]|uniref:NADPH-dependent oxidoreductase n=1 Tax=unclassified Fusibacter TaxID=2624464 RepID=UPI001010D78B|nr:MULTISPECIES: NADPH-dependent oxidoreductase [unclassified Fusibacter]MCK8058560.1 NADPH-dependent oxidoreductase [Fusibacter sp. A2]NPE22671.1 NADPH-dependent oxidoreductase [Fusibacter sp. A1]RXV60234.1 NADPH-dependent oxidoreductase [Fusibacter sp. A1]